jgi:glucokinase
VAGVAERTVIGVDIGGTKLLAGAVDSDLAVSHRTNRPVLGLDQVELLEMIADAVAHIRNAVGDVAAVGFGLPCTFDRRTGVAVQAVHLPLRDLAFAAVMEQRLGLPVFADNDGNCSALCEVRAGAARGAADAVMIALGTGIGSGIVIGGRLYRGATGAGAEIGHMVVDYDGPPCHGNCPNFGCLEVMASGTALVRLASLGVSRRPDTALGRALEEGLELTGPLVTSLASEGDPVACEAMTAVGRSLGIGLANVVNIFNPSVIVVGGGVIGAGELLLRPAREEMLARALAPGRDEVRVVAAEWGAEAGMVGAAIMAREEAGLAAAGPSPGLAVPSPSPFDAHRQARPTPVVPPREAAG